MDASLKCEVCKKDIPKNQALGLRIAWAILSPHLVKTWKDAGKKGIPKFHFVCSEECGKKLRWNNG